MSQRKRFMEYHIVAGEEMKKKMEGVLPNPIPFNEDLNVGSYSHEPFSDLFFQERCRAHHVALETYLLKLSEFLIFLGKMEKSDTIHLYFGDDPTCKANRELLISYLSPRVSHLYFHHMDEYRGTELSVERIR